MHRISVSAGKKKPRIERGFRIDIRFRSGSLAFFILVASSPKSLQVK
jgi:hypothetical protein